MKGQVLTELSRIANNITTQDSGYVLDARQASVLREAGKDFLIFTHSKDGTIHNLTLSGKNSENIKFVATADFNEGDIFKINNVMMTAKMTDGNPLQNKYFTSGSIVICFRNNNNLYFIGQEIKSITTTLTITLKNSDGRSTVGRTVTIKNAEDNQTIITFTYQGQPYTVHIPIGTRYYVQFGEAQEYVTPPIQEYTAIADTPRVITAIYELGTRYGFRREKANSDPSTRITYLYDAVGMTPITTTLGARDTNYSINYGSWKDFIDTICRPVMLKIDGTVDYELDHSDQTKRLDNGQSSDVDNINYNGNAMVEFHSFKWIKRYEDENYEYIIFSNVQWDSSYHAYAFTDKNGIIKDSFYWGMFEGTFINGIRLSSFGTGNIIVSQKVQDGITRAEGNGDRYYITYKSGWDYICDLLTLISKNDNAQVVFGNGRITDSKIAAGTLKNKGPFFGYSSNTKAVKVFYIENFYSNVWERTAGFILDNGEIKTKMIPPYNLTGEGYDLTGIIPSGSSGGYTSEHSCTDIHGYVPKTASGTATTYICDGFAFKTNLIRYAEVGGAYTQGQKTGPHQVDFLDEVTATPASVGTRLTYV